MSDDGFARAQRAYDNLEPPYLQSYTGPEPERMDIELGGVTIHDCEVDIGDGHVVQAWPGDIVVVGVQLPDGSTGSAVLDAESSLWVLERVDPDVLRAKAQEQLDRMGGGDPWDE